MREKHGAIHEASHSRDAVRKRASLSQLLKRKEGDAMRSRSRLFVLLGGLLGLVAFFLPWLADNLHTWSLFDLLQPVHSGFPDVPLGWLYPVSVLLLTLCAALAGKLGKAAYGVGLTGGLIGLGSIIYVYARYQAHLDLAVQPSPSAFASIQNGFYLAGLAVCVGLLGAIIGLNARQTLAQNPLTTPPSHPAGAAIAQVSESVGKALPLKSRFLSTTGGALILCVALVALTVTGSVGFLSMPLSNALPSDIPLPTDSSFIRVQRSVYELDDYNRVYRVANTTLAAVYTFYNGQLPARGWQANDYSSSGSGIQACKGDTALEVRASDVPIERDSPPNGGVLLFITLTPHGCG